MDRLIHQPLEITENIFSHLSEETLTGLLNDEKAKEIVEKVYSRNRFWMLRTELLLGYELELSFTTDWKTIYNDLREKNLQDAFIDSIGHTDTVALLLQDERVDPSARDNKAIRGASEYGYTEVIALLLQDKRVDPSAYNNFAIRWASENGHTNVVALLLQDKRDVSLGANGFRADPSANNNEAIRRASMRGRTEVVALLLQDERVV